VIGQREGEVGNGRSLAVVGDQLSQFGGTERAVQATLGRFPEAQLIALNVTTSNAPRGSHPLAAHAARLVGPPVRRRPYLSFLRSRQMASVQVEARVVLSFTHAGVASAVGLTPGARHVCYASGVPHYLYGHISRQLQEEPALLRPLAFASIPALRKQYRRAMRRPHRLIAPSHSAARDLERVHRRSIEVLYPPVRTAFFTPAERHRRRFLVVARLLRHKRVDIVLDAFRGIDGEVVIAGGGPLLANLRASAPSNASFTGFVSDEELRELYRSSLALICPSVEEFGIVMAEAQACGTPVIAPRAGGACEIVWDGMTGKLLDRVTPEAIARIARQVETLPFDANACRESAVRFSEVRFLAGLERVIVEELAKRGASTTQGRC
jgi:glycosyltransferase involved in cell wall biosynthesis